MRYGFHSRFPTRIGNTVYYLAIICLCVCVRVWVHVRVCVSEECMCKEAEGGCWVLNCFIATLFLWSSNSRCLEISWRPLSLPLMCFLLHQHWDLNSGTQTYTGSTLSHFSSPGHFNFLSVLACLLACFSAEGCGRGIPHPASQEALRNHVREFASWLLSGIHQDLATSYFFYCLFPLFWKKGVW